MMHSSLRTGVRTGILYQCPLCHADFIALIGPASPLPPDRCCFCGHHPINEPTAYEVRVTVIETESLHAD